MANAFTVITKYLTNAVDTVLATESKTALLENGSKFMDLDFKEAGYVRVLSILMDGLSDYYRVNNGTVANPYAHYQNGSGDGYRVGNSSATWEIFRLKYDRGRQFQVDNMDNEELAGQIIANLLTEFLRTKVVPEIDTVRFSTIAGYCSASLGNLVSETPTATDADTGIIHRLNAGIEWLTEREVPMEDMVIFVNPKVMTLIRNTPELSKYILQTDFNSERGVTFTLPAYNGIPIVEVPSNRFYTNAVVSGENGYYPGADSHLLNFMILSKKAAVPVVKLQKSKIWGPDQVQDFDGFKVNFRLYHDLIVPKNKVVACYASEAASIMASAASNILDVVMTEGSAENTTVIKDYYTTPAGMLGTLYYNSTAYTLGASASGTKIDEIGEGIDLTITGASVYFALVQNNVVIATSSKAVTVPKKSE